MLGGNTRGAEALGRSKNIGQGGAFKAKKETGLAQPESTQLEVHKSILDKALKNCSPPRTGQRLHCS